MSRLVGEPDKGCYGCLGTGFLVGFGSRPNTPCSCVTHSPDCEPDGCAPDCPEHKLADGFIDGFMRCPNRRCRRIIGYMLAPDHDPTVRIMYPHPPCEVGLVVKDYSHPDGYARWARAHFPPAVRVPLELCVCGEHFDCPDGWHSDEQMPCSCTPDCALDYEDV